MGNQPELVEFYVACFLVGAVAVPLNSRFQTAEVEYACEKCTPRILLIDSDRVSRSNGVVSTVSSLERLFVVGDRIPNDADPWAQFVQDTTPVDLPTLTEDLDHPALIMFTSGSTSRPKGVTHTHRSILSTVKSRHQTQGLHSETITLVATGICHAGASLGMTLPTLYAGGTAIIMEEFAPVSYLDAVARYRPTLSILLPTELLEVVEHPQAQMTDFGSFSEFECGGNFVSHDLYEHFRKVAGFDLMQMFGLTECEGACLTPPSGPNKVGSMGKPRKGVELRLEDHSDRPVPVGEVGEIHVRSDSVMKGYWEDEKNTRKAFVDGWLRTGDLGRQDEDGYYYFVGRIKEIIVKGGSNVSPGEVEDVMDDHPDVVACAVVGKPDPVYGELIHAFVECEHHADPLPTCEQLASYASKRLATYKVPDGWTFLEKLPRNAVGKIDRNRLHVMAANLPS